MLGWRQLLLCAAALPLTTNGALAQTSREAALEARVAELERLVSQMRGELGQARQDIARDQAALRAADTRMAAAEKRWGTSGITASTPADGFVVAGTTLKINGFIKANAIVSSYSGGDLAGSSLGRDFYLPQTIPVGGTNESNDFDGHAKQTRLWLTASTPIEGHTLKGHVEVDFQTTPGAGSERTTNGYNVALRRGFVVFDNFLAGQEWTNFQNTAVLPETTDFVGPTEGTVFVRQLQFRYTQPIGKGLTLSASVENSETASITPVSPALIENDDDRIPDFTARLGYAGGWGEASVAGVVRQLSVDNGVADGDSLGWGISGAGKILFGGKKQHDLRMMLTYGQGIGRYVGLNFAPDAIFNGSRFETADVLAGFAALRLAWTPKLRSTFMGSFQEVDYPDAFAPLTASSGAWSLAANLFYSPVKGLDLGFEYRHGERELVSGDSGNLDRTEFVAKYSF